jgi:hypothetical protein
MLAMVAALPAACTPANTPLSHPEEVMTLPWGPFARQCTQTRTAHYVLAGKAGLKEVVTNDHSCVGFVAMPAAGGAMQITGSTTADESSSGPVIYRILRAPSGISRPATAGDNGVLAQGSDDHSLATSFANQIGLTRQQIIDPEKAMLLPIMLHVPSPVMGTLRCRPDGGSVDRGRKILVFSCVLDEQVHTERVDATLRLAGVEEVDVMTGVRLSGSFAGSLNGREKTSAQAPAEQVHDHVWYERTMEFE